MKRICIFLVLLFITPFAYCKTVLVSDIDDTIRSFHSGADWGEMLDNASDPRRAFRGMSEIYNYMSEKGAEVHYVTAAVHPFVGMSQEFLEKNQFPQVDNYSHKGWFEDTVDFKVAAVKDILSTTKASDTIILLGDNGDKDVEVYRQVALTYPNVIVFIHKLFPGPLATGQNIYLTGADLAFAFEQRGLLLSQEASSVYQNILADLNSNDEFVFDMIWPAWGETTPAEVDLAFGAAPMDSDLMAIKTAIF